MTSVRFRATDAVSATRQARREAADSLIESSFYPLIQRAAEKGQGKVRLSLPFNLAAEMRAQLCESLKIDGYRVSDEPGGVVVTWDEEVPAFLRDLLPRSDEPATPFGAGELPRSTSASRS